MRRASTTFLTLERNMSFRYMQFRYHGIMGCDLPEWQMDEQKGTEDDWEPQILETEVRKDAFVAKDISCPRLPYFWTVNTRQGHAEAGNDQSLGGAIEVSKIEGVGVVGFPGGEPHWQNGDEGCEPSGFCVPKAHGRRFTQTSCTPSF